ncbi:MAG: PAS domain-containing protein [Cyanobacteria bacterium P01_G01_bin.54]
MSTTLFNTQQAALSRMLRAIAQTTDFEQLVGQLTQIMLAASGAQRCLLVLPEAQQWFVWAMAQTCPNCLAAGCLPETSPHLKLCSQRLEQCPHVPVRLMLLAQRQQRALGLTDIAPAPDLEDPYLRQHQPQSLLCQPVIVQGQTIALWYWEHPSQAGLFSAETVSELEILATQAAIAIDHARLRQSPPPAEPAQKRTAAAVPPAEQLQMAKQHLQQLAENFPGVLYQFQLDLDGSQTFLFASSGSRDLYELEPHQMSHMFELVHPDYRLSLQRAIATSAHTLSRFCHEHPITTPSGARKWVKVVANPTRQAQGVILWDGLVLDITQSKRTELQLRLSEQRFRNIFHNLPMVAMQIYDRDRRVVDWNDASTSVYGYCREEAIGRQLEDLIIPSEMRQGVIDAVEAWVQGGPAIPPEELSLLHKDGFRVSVYSTHFLLPNAQGEPEMYCLDIDLRERQRAEAELKRSKNLLESVINTLPGGVFFKDRNLNYLGCNQFFAQAAGESSPAELVGKSDYDLPWTQQEADFFRDFDRRVITSGQAELGVVEPAHHAHGKLVWSETSKAPLRDEMGQVIGLVGIFQDVTQREEAAITLRQKTQELEQALQALQETKDLLQMVINTLPGAVFWKDCNLVYQGANEYFAQISGLVSAADVVGKTDADLSWTHTSRVFSPKHDRQLIDSGNAQIGIIESQPQAPGEPPVWLETSKAPLLNEAGDVMGIVGIFQDVSRREEATTALRQKTQELEQALTELQQTQLQLVQTEKMSSLGQLVAGVAHEINNPVTFIHGNIDYAVAYMNDLLGLIERYRQCFPDPPTLIQDHIKDIDLEFVQQDFQELMKSMQVGTDRIKDIVNSLRNFSRLDQSAVKAVNLHDGIDSTLTILQTRLRAQDWRPEIVVSKDYGELPRIECYAGQLNQVFMNIISNSIDALEERDRHRSPEQMRAQPSQIQITTRALAQAVEIQIQDNGPGMTANTHDRLFDPFFTTKTVGQGTGLGLSISYQIITETHSGSLHCCSKLGAGATFTMTLPLQLVAQPAQEITTDL